MNLEEEILKRTEIIKKLKEQATSENKILGEDNGTEENYIFTENYEKNYEKNCDECGGKVKIEEMKAKTNNPKAFAIYKLVELFSQNESGEKAKGRKLLLDFCMIFISVIFITELAIIILQGLNILKLHNIVFLGTLTTITTAIIFILRVISKYLYNNESDKILQTIEKVIENI